MGQASASFLGVLESRAVHADEDKALESCHWRRTKFMEGGTENSVESSAVASGRYDWGTAPSRCGEQVELNARTHCLTRK